MSAINTSANTGRSFCKVVDYASRLPNDAKCISLRIADSEVPVNNANDVLVWVCKKMTLHRTKLLQTCIRARKTSWIKTNGNGMGKPCQIAYNCFVDLDASGRTALQRASLILQWLSWPSDDAIITFERASSATPKPVQGISMTKVDSKPVSVQMAAPSLGVGASKDMAADESEISSKAKIDTKRFSYKYDNVVSITDAKPLTLLFKGKEYTLDGDWINLPEKICFALETLWPCKLHDIVGRGDMPNMALNPTELRKGRLVNGAGIWYETNCTAREFIKQTRSLCKLFGVPLENVSITLVRTAQQSPKKDGDSLSTIGSHETSDAVKIGVFVKEQIYAAFAENRVPDADFDKLLTVEGTKELLGTTLSACPLFAFSPMIGPDGRGAQQLGRSRSTGAVELVWSLGEGKVRRSDHCRILRTRPHQGHG